MKNFGQKLFDSVKSPVVQASEYEKVEVLKKTCETLSRMTNQSIYIIDYARQEYFYVSPHPLFLCGYTVEEVMAWGFSFLHKILSPEDMQMILEVNRFGWKLVYEVEPESRSNFCASYDFYFHHKNGTKALVNHKLSPFWLTPSGDIWLAICTVSYSPAQKPGNVVLTQGDKTEYYTYDFDKKKILPHQPDRLTKREEEILLLMIRGNDAAEIADALKISTHTVKNHRTSIEKKLGVKNLSNAVGRFYSMF